MKSLQGRNVLIAGGSGMIGHKLQELLKSKGFEVRIIGRKPPVSLNQADYYYWNTQKQEMDESAIPWADIIINLAGAGIADKRWSPQRKKEIEQSRLQAARLLNTNMAKHPGHIKVVIAASAIGYYGTNGSEKFDETAPAGSAFLARVCRNWEDESSKTLARLVIFRIGIVLSSEGGALQEMAGPFRFFIGTILGNGQQVYSWIHIDDLCGMILLAIQKEQMAGIYNAVAPQPVTQEKLIQLIGAVKKSRYFKIKVPSFLLRIILGDRAGIVLDSQFVLSDKIRKSGYSFLFQDCKSAIANIWK